MPGRGQALIRYEDVRWGIQGCETEGCPNDAQLIYDDTELLCIQCTDSRLERLQIIATYGRDALANLPPVGEWYEEVQPFRKWERDENGAIREVSRS